MANVGFIRRNEEETGVLVCPTVFIVRNIAPSKKDLSVFTYPIRYGQTRDLMLIPFLSEADIRNSLLKGELLIKFKAKELVVTSSNIDLLQFDDCQRDFLESIGITIGISILPGDLPYAFKDNITLIGPLDNVNRTFTTPHVFINGFLGDNEFKIQVDHNGRHLIEEIDYTISESGGPGTGFDTVTLITLTPTPTSKLTCNYTILIP